jgi:DNA-3-methyladenine glycosylase II
LILFILEQQVSLASAYAAFKKLKEKVGYVTPAKILALTDAELRSCYFSRQKIIYARELAKAVQTKQIRLNKIAISHEDEIRHELKKIKGIGDWTVDVYLMHSLQRTDLFPLGDIALVNSLKEIKQLHPHTTKEKMLKIAEPWRPYRTVASMILWHAYIQKRGIKLQG